MKGINMYKCHICQICNGYGCQGELPGMGGVFNSANFIANYQAWKKYYLPDADSSDIPLIRLAPITGAVENVGYHDETPFYDDLIKGASQAGFLLSIGDGYPDAKLQGGIAALKAHGQTAAVFIKPFPIRVFLNVLIGLMRLQTLSGLTSIRTILSPCGTSFILNKKMQIR